jgi:hypothetical protein
MGQFSASRCCRDGRTLLTVTPEQYTKLFKDQTTSSSTGTKEADSRAGRALSLALDIRKFEIELYWKRATYFWAFIAASFAGYGLTYKNSTDHEPWLSLLFSALGLVFSFTWYLVNRGSKFWQNNWERHVDLLEDITLGPLYKIIAEDTGSSNPLTSAAAFSVSKLNQILSVFVTSIWALLFTKSLLPISFETPVDWYKALIFFLTATAIGAQLFMGTSSNKKTTSTLRQRETGIIPAKVGKS